LAYELRTLEIIRQVRSHPMLNPNDHVLDYVDDLIHEVLDAGLAQQVERHCESCRICKVALEEARKRQTAFATLPACEASADLVQATLKRVDAYTAARRRTRKMLLWCLPSAAAAAVLVLSLFHWHYATLSPTPLDLLIFGQSQLFAGTDGSLRVRLVDPHTGAARAGVPVDIELRNPSTSEVMQLTIFSTDQEGSGRPHFRLPEWQDGSYELRLIARPPSGPEVLSERVQLKRDWKLMLTSDKPVYQPGQTIHVRSLTLRRPDLKPVAGQTMTFTVADPKGNVIFKQTGLTSTFGIASIDCPLATEILEGAYTVTARIGATESKAIVEIKKYVLPKFKIDVSLDRAFCQPGQVVHGKVKAAYFFGKPVADGLLEIEVRTTDVGFRVLKKLTARTSAKGGAEFEFTLPEALVGREQPAGDGSVSVQVQLTDTAGQKQAKRVSRVVTSQPLRIEVIPESDTLVPTLANTIYFFVSYADGRPARARLTISGFEGELQTNDLGVARLEAPPSFRRGALTVRATDDQGQVGSRPFNLTWGATLSDFVLRTDKAVYPGAAPVNLLALGDGVQPVFVDFIKDDQTILAETIDMANGRGTLQVDLPPALFGTVKLCAYRFGTGGITVRKTRMLYIRQARQLEIKAALDRQSYQPGHRAKLQLSLTDQEGKPTPGALSLAAVDEAVYAVLDQAPSMEKTFYLLEQQLLKPVYAIYPWSPDLTASSPPPERDQFDQALFARTAKTERLVGASPAIWRGIEDAALTAFRKDSPYSLTDSSFPAKEQKTQMAREAGLRRVEMGWKVFGGCLTLLLYAIGWVLRPGLMVKLTCLGLAAGVVLVLVHSAKQQGGNEPNTEVATGFAKADRFMAQEGAPLVPAAAMASGRDMGAEAGTTQAMKGTHPVASRDVPNETTETFARVREWFPETLLWRPEVITDEQGHANVDIDLADSITTWRLMASAVAADGRLGAAQSPVRVFQPFFVDLNLPVSLTRGDEVALPVVVYNYLDKPQTVALTLHDAAWFEWLDAAVKQVELAPGQVKSTSYRIRVSKVGSHELQVMARAGDVADAIKKAIEVVPDGRRVEQVFNGTLRRPAEIALSIPAQAVEGSPKVILKLYPSTFSQLVEGLDAIFRLPNGCFEQTSSTTYPNVLALDYLRRSNKRVPEVEAKARQYIHLGYQRLVSFEVPGGGFDWFGRPPAHLTLTAYGLMEFQDMAKVHDVGPNLISRTRQWLLAQRGGDGSWSPSGNALHEDPTHAADGQGKLSTTAYVAWAVFQDGSAANEARATYDYLLAHKPEGITDPHALALVCNALLAIDPKSRDVRPYLDRLESLKNVSPEGKRTWWEQAPSLWTTFHGSGRSGSVETTALATLAFFTAGQSNSTARGALTWLAEQKDASGTWHSTQATVLALKALLAGTDASNERERLIEIRWGESGQLVERIAADQAEVVRQIDLTSKLGHGDHRLVLTDRSDAAVGYQLTLRYHLPGDRLPERAEPLAIDLVYDRTDLVVNDVATATATVRNRMGTAAPMVMLDLPIPAGFTVETGDLAQMLKAGSIAKYQMASRQVIVYLRGLEPNKPLELRYRLHATMPVRVSVPGAHVYEYYNPEKKGSSARARITVR
jgi:uncharacterized protein YfaS (alpha-2-macroglobulin family)